MSGADRIAKRPSIALLVVLSAVNPLAINIYMPSMPRMAGAFDTTYAMIQLTLSLYLAIMAVAQTVIGPLSDRYGRRPVLLGGIVVFIAGSVLALSATTVEVLLVGRLLQGAGGCAGIVLARAIVRDLYDRDRAASMIGYVTMGMAVAPMLAPALGGVLEEAVGWRGSFVVMLLSGLGALVWAMAALHETNPNVGRVTSFRETARQWGELLAVPAFWAYSGAAAFASAVFFAFLGGAPYVTAEIMDAGPVEYGLYFILVSVGYMIGNFLTGRFAARIGVPVMINVGNMVQLVAVGSMAAAFAAGYIHPLSLFGPMFLVGLGNGVSLPSAIAGSVSIRPDLAGAASGLGGSMQVGVGAIASSLAGALLVTLWPGTVWSMVALMVVASLAGVACGVAVWIGARGDPAAIR
ncbi:MAG TPA: multidrug effflux MFS transporter [Methylomirabilota bacterium]|nr:multidrug effflux MFS transporter [Methylomirabilota bacterium]